MEKYEGMFIFRPDLSKDALDKALGQVQETINKNKGSIDQTKELGKQKLAYSIKKAKEGGYYLINFHIPTDAITSIKRSFGLNESILRALIIRL